MSAVLLHLPPDPQSAATARRFVERELGGWARPEIVDDAVLLVDELVANAVLHAGTAVTVSVSLDADCIRVEVSDGTDVMPVRRVAGPGDLRGRGLQLVERVADGGWGVAPRSSGKSVWFALHTTRTPSAGSDRRG